MVKITINEKTVKGMLLVTREDQLIDKYFSECDTMPLDTGLEFLSKALLGSIWDAKDKAYTCKLLCGDNVKAGMRLMRFSEVNPKDLDKIMADAREAIKREVNY